MEEDHNNALRYNIERLNRIVMSPDAFIRDVSIHAVPGKRMPTLINLSDALRKRYPTDLDRVEAILHRVIALSGAIGDGLPGVQSLESGYAGASAPLLAAAALVPITLEPYGVGFDKGALLRRMLAFCEPSGRA